MKILIIVTNVAKYHKRDLETGLWLGELVHFWDIALANGFTLELASPQGGKVPIDPESLKFFVMDGTVKKFAKDPTFTSLLATSKSIQNIDYKEYAGIYLTGGHGTMYDFVGNKTLDKLIKDFYENGKIVAAVCHGVCGLLDVKLANGSYLLEGKNATGYSWFEETLALRKNAVPFNLESKMLERKAKYSKAIIPLTSHIQTDGILITGQNPFSTKALAREFVQQLKVIH